MECKFCKGNCQKVGRQRNGQTTLVQGVDYAYTLQGWIKGVNSDSLVDEDGKDESIVGKDAYRFSLNYFNGYYHTIGQAITSVFPGHSAFMGSDHKPLYNGNISSMVVGIPKLGETKMYNYGYDQLNRIIKMDSWNGYDPIEQSWEGMAKTDEYKERIRYDANGNILGYLRNGHAGKLNMDSLTYQYNRDGNGHLVSNRLRHVDDSVGAGNYTEDLDDQNADNYEYDAIGNLVKDTKEGIDSIEWTVYGKIKKISKADGSVIRYTYDVSGNRISKAVSKAGDTTTTWYARDAQGNPMGIYTARNDTLRLSEHQLYGSSRLRIWNRDTNMDAVTNPDKYNFTKAKKLFELGNHLGNVSVTISDRKIGHDAGNGTYDYYNADVVTATDYYPFGMGMVGRKFRTNSAYRYGFNGQEKSTEIDPNGSSYTAEFWQYDARIGRRWNVDPVPKMHESPYATFANNPLFNIDPSGADTINITRKTTFDKRQYRPAAYASAGLDYMGNSRRMIDPGNSGLTTTGSIDITAAEGPDVFLYHDIRATIDENGVESINTKNTTELNIRGTENMGYRNGGRNMKGYHDDRYALADMAPGWLLDHYADKNKGFDWPSEQGLRAAKAYQSDVAFANTLQKISNVVYTVSGVYGVARMALAKTAFKGIVGGGTKAYTHNYTYAARIRARALEDPVAHNFPYSFDDVILKANPIIQKDKSLLYRQAGSLNGKDGFFEIGLNPETKTIFHRTFVGGK